MKSDRSANSIIDRVVGNTTNLRSVTLAEAITVDGKCTRAQYIDSYRAWENVVVQASIKIMLKTFEASIKRSSGDVIGNTLQNFT